MRFDGDDFFLVVAIGAKQIDIFLEQRFFSRRMRVMAIGAIVHRVVREFGVLQEIVVAIPAQGRAGFLHEIFILARVRIVAGQTIAIHDRLVNNFFLRDVVVTIGAGVFDRFLEQTFEICRVRRMAIEAIAHFNRFVFEFFSRERIVMARQAKRVALCFQQKLIRRFVRRVAAQTIAVFDRLMLHFHRRHKIFVAFETKLFERNGHFWRHADAAMTLLTIAVGKRLVQNVCRQIWFYRRGDNGRSSGRIFIRRSRDEIGDGIFLRNAVEEKIKPLMFRPTVTCHRQNHEQSQNRNQQPQRFFGCDFAFHRSRSIHFFSPKPYTLTMCGPS